MQCEFGAACSTIQLHFQVVFILYKVITVQSQNVNVHYNLSTFIFQISTLRLENCLSRMAEKSKLELFTKNTFQLKSVTK